MRNIKFRVWDKTQSFYLPHFDIGRWIGHDVRLEWVFEDARFEFQQLTGILDENSREIFEGDIVRYTRKTHEHGDSETHVAAVMYDEETAAWGVGRSVVWDLFVDFVNLNGRKPKSNVEVLGNIFENPNLLNERN
jgi:uncharacterized phage protein (TIGR01671 family)